MELSDFQKVEKANTIHFAKRQDYDLMFNPKTERFRFSEEMFEKLSLEDNSLIQLNKYPDPDRGVYLMVSPGNTGVFMKKKNLGKSKGRAFKNTELESALDEFDMNVDKYRYFTLQEMGNLDGNPIYKINVDMDRYERLVVAKEQKDELNEELASAPSEITVTYDNATTTSNVTITANTVSGSYEYAEGTDEGSSNEAEAMSDADMDPSHDPFA